MRHLLLALLIALVAIPATAQGTTLDPSGCGARTGHNLSVVVPDAPPGTYRAVGSAVGSACFGEHVAVGGAIAFAVWEDDPMTAETDGAVAGEPLALLLDGSPYAELPAYLRDDVVIVEACASCPPADSTTLALLAAQAEQIDELAAVTEQLADERDEAVLHREQAEARASAEIDARVAAEEDAAEARAAADYERARANALQEAALRAATERNAARDSLQAALSELATERAERDALIAAAVAEATADAQEQLAALEAANAEQAALLDRHAEFFAVLDSELARNNSRLSQILAAARAAIEGSGP